MYGLYNPTNLFFDQDHPFAMLVVLIFMILIYLEFFQSQTQY